MDSVFQGLYRRIFFQNLSLIKQWPDVKSYTVSQPTTPTYANDLYFIIYTLCLHEVCKTNV
jgi:hypothetical protein